MGVNFGGWDCLDPIAVRDQLARLDLPCDFFGRPNSYECPTGAKAGMGWLLLSRAALDDLMPEATSSSATPDLYSLVCTAQEQATGIIYSATLNGLCIVDADCIAPALRGDENSAYLVRIADRRWLYRQIPINAAYNVVLPGAGDATGNYLPATINGGTGQPWTWQQLVDALWNTIPAPGLGTAPLLPVTPVGTPENFSFYGGYALDALQTVLEAIGCTLTLNPLTNAFGIAETATTIAATEQALTKYDGIRLWDDEPLVADAAYFPKSVTVAFPKSLATVDVSGGAPFYTITAVDPEGTLLGLQSGTSVWLWDTLEARFDAGGNLLNATTLQQRANERAADYFRTLRLARLRRVYSRPLSDPAILPCSQIASIRWGDRGRGMVTEVIWREPPVLGIQPEEDTQPPLPWVRVTSGVQTIILPKNAQGQSTTIQGYPAVIDSFDNQAGTWNASNAAVWFYGANNEVPTTGKRYQCRLLGLDINGTPIWGSASVSSSQGGNAFAWVKCGSQQAQTVPGKSYFAYPANVIASQGNSYGIGAFCWLSNDLNGEYGLYFSGPSSGQTIEPPVYGWVYQCRQIDTDSNNVPIYQIASWHEAGWKSLPPGFEAWAGIVNTGNQNFAGNKAVIGNLDVGFDINTGLAVGGPGGNNYGGSILCYTLTANPPGQPYGAYGGYGFVVNAFGNISVVYGAITWSYNGQWPTSAYTTSLPDSQFLSLYGGGVNGASVGVGNSNIFFSGGGLANGGGGVNQPGLFIGGSGQFVEGMTGSLSDGTQVVSGLVIGAGGGGTSRTISGSGSTFVDDGSLW